MNPAEGDRLEPLDAILLGAHSGAKLAIIGIINAAVDPYKRQVEALERENAALRTRVAVLEAGT